MPNAPAPLQTVDARPPSQHDRQTRPDGEPARGSLVAATVASQTDQDQLEAVGHSQRRKHQYQDAATVRLTLVAMQRSGPSPSRDAPRDAIDESGSACPPAVAPPGEGRDKLLENSSNIHPSRQELPRRNRKRGEAATTPGNRKNWAARIRT